MTVASFHVDDPQAPAPNLPRTLGVVVCLVSHDGTRVLMEHRADSDLWCLIGGGLEDGESIQECARREVEEETGLRLGECELLGVYSNPSRICSFPDGNVFCSVAVALVGRLPEGHLRCSAESRDLKTLTWYEIDRLDVAATHQAIIADAESWALAGGHVRARVA